MTNYDFELVFEIWAACMVVLIVVFIACLIWYYRPTEH